MDVASYKRGTLVNAFSLFQKCLNTNNMPNIQTSNAIAQLYPIRYLGASVVFQTLLLPVSTTECTCHILNLQERYPGTKRIPNGVHGRNNQSSLFRITSANLICPSINDCRNRVCGPSQKKGEVLQSNRNIPDS